MPTAEEIFATHLLPLYPADARDLDAVRKTDANPANNPSVLEHLADAANVFVKMHASVLSKDCALDFTDASVHRLSAALTADVRAALAASGGAGTAENALFNVVVHGAAYVGACVVRSHGGTWLVRRPLWESRVRLVSRAGEAELAILSWWLHAFASESATLADRYRAYVEVPTSNPESLEPIGAPRALPRLKNIRYDVFYKYLGAHLPEIRDVGADFPSPERFEAYRFRWLDFLFVGAGRMLVIAGPGEGGLHVFWLDRTGFVKSALYACDAFPEPIIKTDADKLVFVVSHETKTQIHETLWWGP
ncbi:MAG TPA: hypothetical protein VGH87_27440 [Polyangiaceae bacterium]